MVYNTGKNIKNTLGAVAQGRPITQNSQPTGVAPQNGNNSPQYATQSPTASKLDSSYVPGSDTNTQGIRLAPNPAGLAAAQERLKINNFAQQAEAARRQYREESAMQNSENRVYNDLTSRLASRPYPTAQTDTQTENSLQDTDYAAMIYRLLAMEQTPEVQEQIRQLQAQRNQKIGQNPDTYGQYRGDDVDRAATTAANRIYVDDSAWRDGVDSMRANAQGIYGAQKELALMEFTRQAEAARRQYSGMRNQIRNNAARSTRGMEETLAAQGLGRGYGNAASSGFGETSRAMANASLNNNLYNAMQNEEGAVQGLQNQYNQNQLQTYSDYANLAMGIDKIGMEQQNAYDDRKITAGQINAQNSIEQMRAYADRYSAEMNAEYQKGSLMNEQARIALDEKLGIKELEIKEKGIDLQNDQFYANLDLEQKQYALDKWYKENLISIQQYEAESSRIQAEATKMNAETNAQKKTSVGGGSRSSGSFSNSSASYTPASASTGGSMNGYNPVDTLEKYSEEVGRSMAQNPGNPEATRRMIQQWQDSGSISAESATALMRANGLL